MLYLNYRHYLISKSCMLTNLRTGATWKQGIPNSQAVVFSSCCPILMLRKSEVFYPCLNTWSINAFCDFISLVGFIKEVNAWIASNTTYHVFSDISIHYKPIFGEGGVKSGYKFALSAVQFQIFCLIFDSQNLVQVWTKNCSLYKSWMNSRVKILTRKVSSKLILFVNVK